MQCKGKTLKGTKCRNRSQEGRAYCALHGKRRETKKTAPSRPSKRRAAPQSRARSSAGRRRHRVRQEGEEKERGDDDEKYVASDENDALSAASGSLEIGKDREEDRDDASELSDSSVSSMEIGYDEDQVFEPLSAAQEARLDREAEEWVSRNKWIDVNDLDGSIDRRLKELKARIEENERSRPGRLKRPTDEQSSRAGPWKNKRR
eukprot:jgi/Mesvir1/79/Mv18014-RA.1